MGENGQIFQVIYVDTPYSKSVAYDFLPFKCGLGLGISFSKSTK